MGSGKIKTGKKRIKLVICIGSSFVGGNERQLKRLTQELTRRNYQVTIVASAEKYSAQFFRSFSWARRVIISQFLPHPTSSVIRLLKKDPPDIILHSGAVGFSVEIARYFNKPLIWRIIGHPNWRHGNKGTLKESTKHLMKMLTSFSDHIIFLSNYVKGPFLGLGLRDFDTIYNGCDTTFFQSNFHRRLLFRREFGLNNEDIAIGVVANVLPQKKHETVIQALSCLPKNCPPFKCFFIGEFFSVPSMQIQKKRLDRLITKHGLGGKIIFTGMRSDSKKFMNGLDIHLFPFQGEGCTNALLEAMACEKTVIASNKGPFPEIFHHKQEGIMVPAENPKIFAKWIHYLICNTHIRERLGRKARLRVLKQFSLEKQVDSYDRLFRSYLHKFDTS